MRRSDAPTNHQAERLAQSNLGCGLDIGLGGDFRISIEHRFRAVLGSRIEIRLQCECRDSNPVPASGNRMPPMGCWALRTWTGTGCRSRIDLRRNG